MDTHDRRSLHLAPDAQLNLRRLSHSHLPWSPRVAIAVLWAGTASAELKLEWDAPQSCTARPAGLEAEGGAGSAEVQIREVGPEAWTVTVLFFEPVAGFRRVTVRSCEEAVETASFLVRLGSRGTGSATSPPPSVAAPAKPVEEAARSPWGFSLSGGGALDLGVFPGAEPRLAASFSATRGLFRVALDGRFGLLQRVTNSARAQRAAEVQGAGCLNFGWGRASGGPCVAVAGGSWRIITDGGTSASAALLSVGPQARGALVLFDGLELEAVLGLRFNLRRPVPFTGEGVLFTTGLISGEFQLGLGWRW